MPEDEAGSAAHWSCPAGPPHSLGKAGRSLCGCQSQNLLSGRGSWRSLDSRPGLARPPAVECVSAMCHRPRLWEKAAQLTSRQLPCARPGVAGKQEPPAAQAPGTLPSARCWPAPTLSQPTRGTRKGLPLLGSMTRKAGSRKGQPSRALSCLSYSRGLSCLSRLALLDGTVS